MSRRRAFTLVELLVVIAIIGLLSTVAVVTLNISRVKARDTKRKADLLQITKALELYYSDNGAYPDTSGVWRGNCSAYGGYPDTGAGAWIPNFQNYMSRLPHDPTGRSQSVPPCSTNGADTIACYTYVSDAVDYKVVAHCTPEAMVSGDPYIDPIRGTWAYALYSPGAAAKGWH